MRSLVARLFGSTPAVWAGAPLLTHPVSQACTQSQFAEDAYAYWCRRIGETPRNHRKQWEFCYILQSLARTGAMAPGLRGLGFGVGVEPLTAVFASEGMHIVATDLAPDQARVQGWIETNEHAANKSALNERGLCDALTFDSNVVFRYMDMTAIDGDLKGFDFCWSACALEHLGSIEQGLEFVVQSLECLKPGGVAVHTTEFNCTSDAATLDAGSTVLFRKRDLLALGRRLTAKGHEISFNFALGVQPLDRHYDLPPYSSDHHIKLKIEEWVSTSFGLLIKKALR